MPARFPAGAATAHCICLLLLLVATASAAALSPASTIGKTALLVRRCTSSSSRRHRSFPLAASLHRLAFSSPLLIRSLQRQQQQRRRFLNPFPSVSASSIMTAPTIAAAANDGSSSSSPVRAKVITDARAAGQLLRTGNLVAFPTETVYGLGASVYDEAAVRRIFAVKGRPLTDPLIAHVVRTEDAWAVFRCGGDNSDNDNDGGNGEEKEKEQRLLAVLAEKFWPGPLTLVAPAASAIPGAVTAGTGWVGVRCPAHPLARALLEEADVPVVAPSANRFGHVSPTSAAHVLADLGAHDIAVLDGDTAAANREGKKEGEGCRIGIESTVAKVDAAGNTITILRAGAVTASQLLSCLASHGMTGVDVRVLQRRASLHKGQGKGQEEGQSVLEEAEGPQVSPGQSITHYAPDRPTFLLSPQQAKGGEGWVQALAARAVVLDVGGRLRGVEAHAAHYRDLSPQGDMREAAAGLFESLRWAEAVGEEGLQVLVVDLRGEEEALPSQEDREFAAALIDRILRAASGRPAGAYLLKEESG